MPIKIEPCRDGRVVHLTLADTLTMAEFAPALLEYETYFNEHLPHVVIDALHLSRIPAGAVSFVFQETNFSNRRRLPESGQTYIATRSQGVRAIISAIRHLIPPQKIFLVNTVTDAWAAIDSILGNKATAE